MNSGLAAFVRRSGVNAKLICVARWQGLNTISSARAVAAVPGSTGPRLPSGAEAMAAIKSLFGSVTPSFAWSLARIGYSWALSQSSAVGSSLRRGNWSGVSQYFVLQYISWQSVERLAEITGRGQ
jgi:hypothetical protein